MNLCPNRFAAAICTALLGLAAPTVMAWGPEGHGIVADIAQAHLDTAAATEVPINCRRVYRSGLSHYRRRPGGAAGIARAVIGIIGQIPFAQHAIAEGTC